MSTLKERLLAGATIVGAAIACVVFGYTIGKDTNDGLVNFLREKSQLAEITETKLRAEVSSLKLELQGTKTATAPPVALDGAASGSASASADLATKPNNAIVERVTIRTGETAQLFGGQIAISVVGIKFDGDPLRHKVIGVIGSPGKQNKPMELVDVGFAAVYEEHEIRLIASDTFTATFIVTRVSKV